MRFNEPNVVSLFLGFAPKKNSCGVICTPILNFPSFFFLKPPLLPGQTPFLSGTKSKRDVVIALCWGGVD